MTLQDNAIQGNQRDHQGSMTSGREERKSNWQGWPARIAIGITLLFGGWWIAAQDFGFLYNLLIAVLLWWGAGQIKRKKSSDHEEVVWYWPDIVRVIAVLVVSSSFLQMPITQSALNVAERVTESTRPIYDPDTGDVQVMMDPQTGEPIRHLSPKGCESSELGYCIDTETGEKLLVYDAALSKRLQDQAMTRQRRNNHPPCTTMLGGCEGESIPPTREPTLPTVPRVVRECPTGSFARAHADGVLGSCAVVTLYRGGQPYQHEAGPNFCVFYTNEASVRLADVDDNGNSIPEAFQFFHRGSQDQIQITVYDLNDGQEFRGNEC